MDEVVHLKMAIDDTNAEWDTAVDRINARITEKAQRHGLEKDPYKDNTEFNIVDMVGKINNCKACRETTYCKEHTFSK